MEHFKYPAIRWQIFPNSQTIYDGQQFTPQEHMKGKQLLVPGGDNLKRPIPAPAVTLSQQPHTILVEIKKKEHRSSNKVLYTSVAPGNLCSICRENHRVERCPLFLKATRPERWTLAKKYGLCFRCLRQGHRSTDCKRSHNSRNVTSVGLHRLLSEDRNVRAAEENCTPHGDERSEKSPETTPIDVSEPTNAVRVCANRTKDTRDRTYLQTAKAYLYAPNGNCTKVMCLFDTGSQRSFVTKGIADSLGLTGLSERVCISTLGNNTCHKKLRRVSFSLKGITPNSQAKQINAYCVNRICDTLEENPPVMWEHAKDLNLADDFPRDRCDVDVLIGIDYYYHFLEDDRRRVVDEWLVALRSTLGWILCGQDSRSNYTDTVKVMRIDVGQRCDCGKHRRFGELKSIGIMDQPKTESPAERNDILLSGDDESTAQKIVCWSDSEVALSWIKSPAVKWKTF
ncbi:hypothetical protein T05_10353, partial [Trichinella murrelli]